MPKLSFDERILDDDWQEIRASSNGDDSFEEWEPVDEPSLPTWPGPDEEAWRPLLERINGEDPRGNVARTLSLFGTGVLPSIRSVWMYGAGHPRPRGSPSWDPTEWTVDDFRATDGVPGLTRALTEALTDTADSYLDWITAPGRYPQATAEHSSKCPVRTEGVLDDVYLASWVWLGGSDAIEALGSENLLELLSRYDEEFRDSILETGWACSNGHQRDGYGWTDEVPTLLNWQLRHLDLWESVVDIDQDLGGRWGEDGSRLAYAVVETGSRGARPSRLFPHVDPDDLDLSEELLDSLCVKSIGSFDVTEAGWHLQRLLAVLATDTLDEEPVSMEIPGERINDWNAAYTSLLEPILRHLPAEDAGLDDLSLPFLTHLPIQRDGRWEVASLEWLEANDESGRYYEDQSPKPWERRAVDRDDVWLLPRTAAGPYSRLTDALGIDRVEASKPVLEPDDLTFLDDSLEEFRSELRNRTRLLVASLEQTSEDRIREVAEDLDDAIADLRVAERFPEDAVDTLADPKSGLYAPREGREAFVFNASAYEGGLSLDGLATAVSLLVEQPTRVATFREALDEDLSPSELADRWRRRTFPLDEVERILGNQRRRELRQQLEALVSLGERFGVVVETTVDEVVESIQRRDDGVGRAEEVFDQCNDGGTSDEEPLPETTLLTELRSELPHEVTAVVDRVVGTDRRPWPEVISAVAVDDRVERRLVDWLAEDARELEASACFPRTVRSFHRRSLAVLEVWNRTETEDLDDRSVWRSRLRSFTSSDPIEWTSPVPDTLQAEEAMGELLFYYTPESEYETLVVDPLVETIAEEVPGGEPELASLLRHYVLNDQLPVEESSTAAVDHQDRALADLGASDGIEFDSESLLHEDFSTGAASTRTTGGGGRGGGSTQYQGRGQQGEAATLVAILNDVSKWLADEPKGMVQQLRAAFRNLQNESADADYQWHLDRVWNRELVPLLSSGALTRERIVDWRESLESGRRLRDHPLVKLCNVALEQGPGFDVIDPFGPLGGQRRGIDTDQFLPVEVKAVGGTSPAFHFRLTTNECRRCKAFLRNDWPYAIRLVYVPEVGQPDWERETKFVSEMVLETVDEADALVQQAPFEEIVKGGYMNMSVDR